MATHTPNSFLLYVQNIARALSDSSLNKVGFIVASSLGAAVSRRIFNSGKDTTDSKIGDYSTTSPKFADKDAFVLKSAFKPKPRKRAVKTGKSPGAKGTIRTTVDLNFGYKELREMQGRQTDYVDLDYSGSLRKSLRVVQVGRFSTWQSTSPKEAQKIGWNETRFGKKIFYPTKKELNLATEIISKEITFLLST